MNMDEIAQLLNEAIALVDKLADALKDYHNGTYTLRPWRQTWDRDTDLLERVRVFERKLDKEANT